MTHPHAGAVLDKQKCRAKCNADANWRRNHRIWSRHGMGRRASSGLPPNSHGPETYFWRHRRYWRPEAATTVRSPVPFVQGRGVYKGTYWWMFRSAAVYDRVMRNFYESTASHRDVGQINTRDSAARFMISSPWWRGGPGLMTRRIVYTTWHLWKILPLQNEQRFLCLFILDFIE